MPLEVIKGLPEPFSNPCLPPPYPIGSGLSAFKSWRSVLRPLVGSDGIEVDEKTENIWKLSWNHQKLKFDRSSYHRPYSKGCCSRSMLGFSFNPSAVRCAIRGWWALAILEISQSPLVMLPQGLVENIHWSSHVTQNFHSSSHHFILYAIFGAWLTLDMSWSCHLRLRQ